MLALRFGSYSIAATFAGTPLLSRRKSTLRYCFLWPPPRCQTTTSPWLLRPPERFFGSRSRFSGVSLVISFLSSTVMNRLEAVYGLKLFSPIAASCYSISCGFLLALLRSCLLTRLTSSRLQIFRKLDHLFARGQLHVCLFPVAAIAFVLPAASHLAREIR